MPSTILSDNGVSSGSAGLKSTAGNDGVLILQTTTSGGTATNAVYIDTSQNVGIGTSSPSNRLSVVSASGSDGFISISSPTTDTAGFSVNGGTDSNKGAIVRFQKGASTKWTMGTDSAIIGGTSDNFHLYSGGANAILFSTNATERMRVNAGAPILCLSGGNTSATGTGIAFPATQSASSDANTLDDYEEGTWGPVTLTNGTCTLTNSRYTKIGRLVTISGYLQNFSDRSTASTLNINGGFPYAPSAATENCGAMIAQYVNGSYSAAYVSSGGMFFYGITSSFFTTLKNSDLNNASAQIYFTVTYTTST